MAMAPHHGGARLARGDAASRPLEHRAADRDAAVRTRDRFVRLPAHLDRRGRRARHPAHARPRRPCARRRTSGVRSRCHVRLEGRQGPIVRGLRHGEYDRFKPAVDRGRLGGGGRHLLVPHAAKHPQARGNASSRDRHPCHRDHLFVRDPVPRRHHAVRYGVPVRLVRRLRLPCITRRGRGGVRYRRAGGAYRRAPHRPAARDGRCDVRIRRACDSDLR